MFQNYLTSQNCAFNNMNYSGNSNDSYLDLR